MSKLRGKFLPLTIAPSLPLNGVTEETDVRGMVKVRGQDMSLNTSTQVETGSGGARVI